MKLLLVCSQGGHFQTMRSLRTFWSVHDRHWAVPPALDTGSLIDEREIVHWIPYQAPRAALAALRNFLRALILIRRTDPDMVLATGASVSVPFIYAAKILGKRTIFVECLSRVWGLSLSGRLVYPIVDEFYVQWQEALVRYPAARFQGKAF